MIRLTRYSDKKSFYLNPDFIVAIYGDTTSRIVLSTGEEVKVNESPQYIVTTLDTMKKTNIL